MMRRRRMTINIVFAHAMNADKLEPGQNRKIILQKNYVFFSVDFSSHSIKIE